MKPCKRLTHLFLLAGLLCAQTQAQDPPRPLRASQQTAIADVRQRADELAAVNQTIWDLAEVGLEETRSSAVLIRALREAGFAVKSGVSGMPTAFVASYGSGKPFIGILAEYDALPGMSQKVAAQREPVTPGAPGHACGHSG